MRTLARLGRRAPRVDINQTICAQNADHIHLTARWLCKRFLDRTGHTFRLGKVPLCYMGEFGRCSTETRPIIRRVLTGVISGSTRP